MRVTEVLRQCSKRRYGSPVLGAVPAYGIGTSHWNCFEYVVARLERNQRVAAGSGTGSSFQLLRSQNGNSNSVRGHYEAAIRHHKGDVGLVVELGAYLLTKGAYEDANKVFGTLRDRSLSAQERNQMRDIWRDNNGKPLVFVSLRGQ